MILGTRLQRIVAAVTVTVVTVAVIGIVLLATTPLGCGPAKAMHLRISSTHCVTVAESLPTPTPFFAADSPSPSPIAQNPAPEPASNQNPNPPTSSGNPYPDTGSGSFPPFGNPGSGYGPPGLALNCRLPIFAGGPGSGGFIVYPGGNFIPDPRSAVTVPSPSPGTSPPPQGPGYGYGYGGWFGTTYDRAYSRWLPVPYLWVTPDGTRYAYPGQPDGIYVQNIANGTQVELGEGKSWGVLDTEANGVYASTGQTGGLWLLTFSGTVTQVISNGYWQAVGGGYAYGTPTSSVPQGATNTILRLDLSTGATVDYFSYPSQQSAVAGFDRAGRPVIYVQGPNMFLIYIGLAPGRTSYIANLAGTNFWPNGPPVGDVLGLWFASGSGIALYVDGVGWYSMSSIGGQLAGGCA